MVQLQSCATLVNASSLCAIEQEVRGDSVTVVAEISAELERERKKNAELMERISMLEAQLRERNKEYQENHQHAVARSLKNFKRQKIEMVDDEKSRNTVKSETASEYKIDTEGIVPKQIDRAKSLVNWMSMDNVQNLYAEKFKDCNSVADFNETDSDDACDENFDDDMENSQRHEEVDDKNEAVRAEKGYRADDVDEESNNTSCMGNFSGDPASNVRQEDHENQKTSCILAATLSEKREVKTLQGKEIKESAAFRTEAEVPSSGSERISQNRKPLKLAFCPKEVKRMIESEALLEKNAQSHTIRKIIVFASLAIRHGCEDMYELDFNHFSILNKGEPYLSPESPGEHVLYENPGVRRKIFYPNRENPVLCPVEILEEERAMRPSDASCPSWLFLCIKYGGRTRNLPQNEYVRQRMGRNKLKSFGPLMCRMAVLVHCRSGSFFFKALGITLLFMAGFPDYLVQKETKYRNLDLLQKYYRTDEDAEGEELFLPHSIACDNGTPEPHKLTKKTLPAKSKGKKHPNAIIKQKTQSQQEAPTSSAATEFGLTGYSSAYTYAMAAFHSMPSQVSSQDISHILNPVLANSITNVSGNHGMLPPQPASSFVPVMYWPPPNVFLPGPYTSTYGYHSFPAAANYLSIHTQPYFNHPKSLEDSGKNDLVSHETNSDTDSSTSG
ncbi:uncharacterized protein LOC106766570 isoform X2 [Vigna radiata var. radiata]|uniref:Uncharacterized protein LOC106766570 isoform X2 n=1 Tax=Vigna radiata var. radiata TaxID=3916 RepID=A0A1S3UL99_VIGRR|nr:uncharacterized protein LOC106766570 isoform X2 [Vigna radiata var. radiata]